MTGIGRAGMVLTRDMADPVDMGAADAEQGEWFVGDLLHAVSRFAPNRLRAPMSAESGKDQWRTSQRNGHDRSHIAGSLREHKQNEFSSLCIFNDLSGLPKRNKWRTNDRDNLQFARHAAIT
jgi:hypothetical protein